MKQHIFKQAAVTLLTTSLMAITNSAQSQEQYSNNDVVILKGDLPRTEKVYGKINDVSTQIWSFVKRLTEESNIQPPVIYFTAFNEENMNDLDMGWSKKWLIENGYFKDNENYPLKGYGGWYYSGTNKIQIDPRVYYEELRGGFPKGNGNYYLGHELIHYALDQKGISTENQHCYMFEKGYYNELARFLDDSDLGNYISLTKGLESMVVKDIETTTEQCKNK